MKAKPKFSVTKIGAAKSVIRILTKFGIKNELENQYEQNLAKILTSNQTETKSNQCYQNLA